MLDNQFLVAPISFDELADTIFDIKFNNLLIDNEFQSGYIHLSNIGYVQQKYIERVCGQTSDDCLEQCQMLLDKIKTIFEIR